MARTMKPNPNLAKANPKVPAMTHGKLSPVLARAAKTRLIGKAKTDPSQGPAMITGRKDLRDLTPNKKVNVQGTAPDRNSSNAAGYRTPMKAGGGTVQFNGPSAKSVSKAPKGGGGFGT